MPSNYVAFSAFEQHATQPLYNVLTEYLTLYHWDSLANRFTRIKTAVFIANWGPFPEPPNYPTTNSCMLTQIAGDPAATGSTTGWKVTRDAAIYRVAVKVTVPTIYGTVGLPVKVIAGLWTN